MKPARRRELAQWIRDRYQVSCRRACALAEIWPNTWYYTSQARDTSALRMRIREIAQARPRFGYVRIWILLRREGWRDNKKRVHRLYRLEGLQVRMRPRRKKRLSLHRGAVPAASGHDQHWSMDFVHDQLVTGRAFRVLTVIDQWSRESVLLEANLALTGQSVVDALEAVAAHRPLPKAITVDHGTEFTSKALDEWAYRRGVELAFIRPGKPVENAFIESFNGRLRDECLNVHSFLSIAHAQALIADWQRDYNNHRPHGALGRLTPSEYAKQRQTHSPEAARLHLTPV
jgi:putative transposase